jgi:tail tube protein
MPNWGWQGQLMWAEESVWGTSVTPTKGTEYEMAEVGIGDETIVKRGVQGNRIRLLTQTKQGRKVVSYSYGFDFYYKGLVLWLKHAMGANVITNPLAGVYLHTITRADALPAGLTTEAKIAPDFYKLAGCRVNELAIESDTSGAPRVTVNGPAKDYTIAGSGAAYSTPANNVLAVFHEAALTIDAVAKQFRSFRLSINNDLFGDDFRSGSRTIYSLDPRDFQVKGSFTLVADENAQLLKIRDFLTAALNVTWTGPVIQTGHNYTLGLDMPQVRYWPTRRRVSGPGDESLIEIEFEAFKSVSDALTVTVKNDEAAA